MSLRLASLGFLPRSVATNRAAWHSPPRDLCRLLPSQDLVRKSRCGYVPLSPVKTRMGQRLPAWIAILLMVFGPFVPGAMANSSWKYCDLTEDYKVSVKGVVVNPDPVVRGNDATFKIPAVTSEAITGGTVTVQVFYLGVPVHTEKGDLCEKTSCPVAPGEFSLSNSQGLPDFTPTGSYRLDMRVQDEDGDLLTCVRVNFRIVRSEAQPE